VDDEPNIMRELAWAWAFVLAATIVIAKILILTGVIQ